MTHFPDQMAVLAFLGLLGWAAVSDGTRFIIPNRVCAGIVLLYPVHVLTSPVPVAWLMSASIAAGIMAAGVFIFSRGWAGGGDVKLFAASSLWAGPGLMSPFLLVTAVAGGVLALGALALTWIEKRKALRVPAGAAGGEQNSPRPVLPYGIAIAMGGAFVAVQLLRG